MKYETPYAWQYANELLRLVDRIDLALAMLSNGIGQPTMMRVVQKSVESIHNSCEIIGQEGLANFTNALSEWMDWASATNADNDHTLSVLKKSSLIMRSWLQACQNGEIPSHSYFNSTIMMLVNKRNTREEQ